MAMPQHPDPVKLFVAILWADERSLESSLRHLSDLWGEIDFTGTDHAFELTDYYASEMGEGLRRRLISFRALVAPESLVEAKLRCNDLEDRLAGSAGRRVNLDVGTIDLNKIVLASAKFAGQKIHLGRGIYADFVCRYKQGRFHPFEWTFPDFSDGRYNRELLEIRSIYRQQLSDTKKPR